MTKESPVDAAAETIRPGLVSDNPDTLKQAMRAARFDDAERGGVQDDLRASQIVRLEMLQEALKPLLAQIPSDAGDLFDVGVMPGTTPRLFIDMIGFVEMGRDSRVYRLLQDSRYVRLTLAESASVPTMVDAVTQYVARRLLEREKALATDSAARAPKEASELAITNARTSADRERHPLRWAAVAMAFIIDLLGAIAFFALLVAAGWYLWGKIHGRI